MSLPHAEPKRIPGEPGLWALILGDLLLFSLFFFTIVYYRHLDPGMFAASQRHLDRSSGLANTLLLLTASLLVVLSVRRVRAGEAGAAAMVTGAVLCGTAFVAIKLREYAAAVAAGFTVASSDFYMLYFAFTGIHLIHVLIGIGVLLFMRSIARRSGPERAVAATAFESGAIFWHLVDLLWLGLFALFYVAR